MATISPLNPLAVHDPAASLSQNVFWKRICNAALATSIIAFTALGVFAITLTSTLWPAHLLSVTILVGGSLLASSKLVKNLWDKAEYYRMEAAYDQKLKNKVEAISTSTLSKALRKIGFSSNASDSVKKNLLSRFHVIEEQVKTLKEKAKIGKEVELYVNGKVRTVRPSDYHISKVDFDNPEQTEIFEALQANQIRRQEFLETAARLHLKAAYILNVIQNPGDLRQFEEIVKLTTQNPIQHIIAKANGDPSAFVLAKASGKNYSRDAILSTNAVNLAQKIYGLRRNWFSF